MNLRTIRYWAIYVPERRSIVCGFRTKKEMKKRYPRGIPIGCVLVKMIGHYLPARRGDSRSKE
jgi:hypothetical protein